MEQEKKSANKIWKESGSTLSFKEWIERENIPKLYVDANTDFKQNPEYKNEILQKIDEFIHSL